MKTTLATVTRAVCAACPATAAALYQVHLVFGAGPRQRGLSTLLRVWGGGEAVDPLPLVEIAEIGGLSPAETCRVLAPEGGHGATWRHAARQVGLVRPRAPDVEPAPAEFFEDRHRLPCGAGYGTRNGTSRGEGFGSRYLKATCQHPGCGYQVRVTRKWLALGALWCPIAGHGQLVLVSSGSNSRLRAEAPPVLDSEPAAQSEEIA